MSLERIGGVGMAQRTRDRVSAQLAQAEFEQQERQEQEERERPLREIQEKYEQNSSAFLQSLQVVVLTEKLDDYDPQPLSGLIRASAPFSIYENHPDKVREACAEFRKRVLDYVPTQANLDALFAFIERNNLDPRSPMSWEKAYALLSNFAALPDTEAPSEQIESVTVEHETNEQAHQRITDYENNIVVTDPVSRRSYSQYQLERLPADEYARLMKIPKLNQYFPQARH